jgi:hypothetical protein
MSSEEISNAPHFSLQIYKLLFTQSLKGNCYSRFWILYTPHESMEVRLKFLSSVTGEFWKKMRKETDEREMWKSHIEYSMKQGWLKIVILFSHSCMKKSIYRITSNSAKLFPALYSVSAYVLVIFIWLLFFLDFVKKILFTFEKSLTQLWR